MNPPIDRTLRALTRMTSGCGRVSSRRYLFGLCLSLLLGSGSENSSAYSLNGYSWPAGSQIIMHLQLNRPPVALQDGSASWNASAADALTIWNQYLDTAALVQAGAVPASAGDGANSVFFSGTIYGESFGSTVLAVTVNYSNAGSGVFTETDVIFNNARTWNSYRGPIQGSGPTATYDFHRVALHEFGHVLGLDHPDEHGQSVTALMNSITSDLDHLADDDVAGGRFLYGFRITSSLNSTPNLGENFAYQVAANNAPTSFSAIGLPAGVTLDPATGMITGIPSISGTYLVTITAIGPQRNVSATLEIQVAIPPGLAQVCDISIGYEFAGQLVADPHLPRFYVLLPLADSVIVVDVPSASIIKTIAVGPRPRGLAIAPDGGRLWVANSESTSGEMSVIDLSSLEKLPSVNLPLGYNSPPYSIVVGPNSRLYIATTDGIIAEVDSNTGAYLGSFYADFGRPVLALSPDASVLFWVDGSSLNRFELAGTSGVRSHNVSAARLQLSSDGKVLYTYLSPYNSGPNGFAKLSASDLSTIHIFSNVPDYGLVTLSGDDAILYLVPTDVGTGPRVDLLDTTSNQLLDTVPLKEDPWVYTSYDYAGLDATGAYLMLASHYQTSTYNPDNPGGDYGQLRIFSTGRTNIGRGMATPKTLVNISTRVSVGRGDDVAIAGFILHGTDEQKVIVRAIGPSLPVNGPLSDPVLELHDSTGSIIRSNDNWNSHRSDVRATGLAPTNEHESAIVATLAPGSYTAVLRGVENTTGVALAEVYAVGSSNSKIANISTRGRVENGDNVMIGGFIIAGTESTNLLVRGIGPSLTKSGVPDCLGNPVLELHDGNGGLLRQNDDWRTSQQQELIESGLAPPDDREAAILVSLQPGAYTAIVRGKDDSTGVGLVEVYNLDAH